MAKPIRIPWRQRTAKSLGLPWLLWGTCWSLSSDLFQTSVVQLRSSCSSDPESTERENFYQGWSFCGDAEFTRQLNHQGLLQEQTFGPESAPNHSCTELQVNWKPVYSIATDPSKRCIPRGIHSLQARESLTFFYFEPTVPANMRKGGR